MPVDFATVVRALVGADDSAGAAIVRDLRLPRALAAFAVGGLLAVAGALLQVLLRNPLADPYVLGVSGGAAIGALGAMFVGAFALVTPAAFAGALASTALGVRARASGAERAPWNATRLLLTGVVVAAGWGALVTLLLTLAPDAQVKGMLFWLIGDLSRSRHRAWRSRCWPSCRRRARVRPRSQRCWRAARTSPQRWACRSRGPRWSRTAAPALATAVAVTTAGSVGFVGLVVPHALRLALGNDQRLLLPASALAGGALLTLADTLARTIAAPAQLPVGVHDRADRRAGVPVAAGTAGPVAMSAPPRLACRGLAVAIAGRTLAAKLDLDVHAGEIWAIVGPNGAGKTTLMATLAGLRPAGRGPHRLRRRRRSARCRHRERALRRGYLPQDSVDFFPATVQETVLAGRHPHLPRWRWEGGADIECARDALAALDLAGLEARDVRTLSGGERRRVALAALLAQDPGLLLLDEPSTHLDPGRQVEALDRLAALARERGKAIVMVVHELHLALRAADHAIAMGDGGACAGTADEVLNERALSGLFGHALVAVGSGTTRTLLPR